MTITIPIEMLRDPFDSAATLIGLEDAAHCDGNLCGEAVVVDGDLEGPGPHHHIVVSGEKPSASRCYIAVLSRR